MIRSDPSPQRLLYSTEAWHLQRFLRYSSPAALAIGEWWTPQELNYIWDRYKYKNCPAVSWTQQTLLDAANSLNAGKPHRLVIHRRECWDGISFVFRHSPEDRMHHPPSIRLATIDIVVWIAYEFLCAMDVDKRGMPIRLIYNQLIQEGYHTVVINDLAAFSDSILDWGNGSFMTLNSAGLPWYGQPDGFLVAGSKLPCQPLFSEMNQRAPLPSRQVAASVEAVRFLRRSDQADEGASIDELYQVLVNRGFADIITHSFALRFLIKHVAQNRITLEWSSKNGLIAFSPPAAQLLPGLKQSSGNSPWC